MTGEGDFYRVDYIRNSFDVHPRLVIDGTMLELLMRQPSVQVDIDNVRHGHDEAKRYLPAVVWGGHFRSGKRRQQDVESSGLFCSDIDHIATDPEGARQYYAARFAGREDELGIVFAHVSPSGTGLHVVCLCQPGLQSVADNQAWLAAQTQTAYDPVCKDMGGIFYLSTYKDIIYNDLNQ